MTAKSSKDMTMAELLARHAHKITNLTAGQRIKAKVVSITPAEVILDIGAKSEGIVKEKGYQEAKELIGSLKVGQEVLATVLVPESRDGTIVMALRDAMHDITWDRLIKAQKEGSEVAVIGRGMTPSGFNVEVEGLSGFIPTSQMGKEASANPQKLVGHGFKTKVIEVDKTQNKIVLSEKEVSEAEDIANAKKVMKSVKEGDIYEGVVTTVANFGCFVKFEAGKGKEKASLEGLVHVSEMSYSRVANPHDFIETGDKVKVKVLAARDGKLALSMKQALKDPWSGVEVRYKADQKVEGRVVRISDFGAFVELEPGVEGLIHITKIPPTQKLEVGQIVKCEVEEVNLKDKRIALDLVLTSVPVGYK